MFQALCIKGGLGRCVGLAALWFYFGHEWSDCRGSVTEQLCVLYVCVCVCVSSGATSAAQLAAAAASQINAKLGVASAGPAPVVGTPDMSALFGIPFGPAQSEIITVPDRMVGLSK